MIRLEPIIIAVRKSGMLQMTFTEVFYSHGDIGSNQLVRTALGLQDYKLLLK